MFGDDCTSEDFPDVGLEDTPHYNSFDDVNIDQRHQDPEWLKWWRTITGGADDEMDDENLWEVTRIDSKVPTPEVNDILVLPSYCQEAPAALEARSYQERGIWMVNYLAMPIQTLSRTLGPTTLSFQMVKSQSSQQMP